VINLLHEGESRIVEGTPFTIIHGGKPQEIITHPEAPSQRFRTLCYTLAVPVYTDTFLSDDQQDFLAGSFGHIVTEGYIRPQMSIFGPTDDLHPWPRATLEKIEISISGAFSNIVDSKAESMEPKTKRALIFTARGVAFVIGDHARFYQKTDDLILEMIHVVEGIKEPDQFNPDLLPPPEAMQWLFNDLKTRV